uniref:Uncharacterized protein n=1 Tax=Lepeophtheirus salmonis TaxID=72036 RepID=A0A0K2V4J1_LEPSM
MKSEDKLFHSSVVTVFRTLTFGVLFVLPFQRHQKAKSRGFTWGENKGHNSTSSLSVHPGVLYWVSTYLSLGNVLCDTGKKWYQRTF